MSGLHILFWNMYQKDLSEALASIVEKYITVWFKWGSSWLPDWGWGKMSVSVTLG